MKYAGNSLNAVEREPVPTRVLNPNASEASYKPKQRSYRKTKLKNPAIVRRRVLVPDSPGTQISGAQMSSAQTTAPNQRHPNRGVQTYPTPFLSFSFQ